MVNIERCLGLHELVEIHYRVDHYAAELLNGDGTRIVVTGTGETVVAALQDLDEKLTGRTLDSVRFAEDDS